VKSIFTGELQKHPGEGVLLPYDWYKTQIYTGAYGECGPTVTAMAIYWGTGEDVDPSEIRDYLGYNYADDPERKGSTTYEELLRAMNLYGADASIVPVTKLDEIVDAVRNGKLVIIGQTMSYITRTQGDWKVNRIGKHHDYNAGHYIILKGLEPVEGTPQYFVVYDPYTKPGETYSNGDPAGKDRLFPVSEVWAAFDWRDSLIEVTRSAA
jgi:hypothetical protein